MKPMYINGQWLTSSDGAAMEVFDPATETVLDTVPNGAPEDALKAIQAAKTAFAAWRWVTALERSEMLPWRDEAERQRPRIRRRGLRGIYGDQTRPLGF